MFLAYNPNGNVAPTNGNVYAAGDSENGNWIYTYDAVNRLHTAAVTGQSFTYSYTAADGSNGQFGNMSCTNTGNLPCSPLGLAISAANNRITSTGYTYDGARNLLTDNTHGYVYDDENRIACVLGTDGTCTSASAVLYLYDADGKRVGKQQGNTLEDYVYDPLGQISSVHDGSANLLRTEFYTPEGRDTTTLEGNTWSTSQLYWNHADWLGTERVRTNSSGTAVEWCTDTPYGMNLTCTPPDLSPMHFTGKQRDWESGLDHFLARYYGSSNGLGRFMTADPAGEKAVKLGDPQTWGMYTYVRNNPLSAVDPNGTDSLWVTDENTGKTTLVIPVHFTGAAATPENVSAIVSRDNTLNTGGSSVNIEVISTDKPISGVLNNMDFSPGKDTKFGSPGEGTLGLGGNEAHIDSSANESIGAAAHDTLHFAGIKDQYNEQPRDANGNRTSTPTNGYDNSNIMTSRTGTNLKPGQIQEAKTNSTTKNCTKQKDGNTVCQ